MTSQEPFGTSSSGMNGVGTAVGDSDGDGAGLADRPDGLNAIPNAAMRAIANMIAMGRHVLVFNMQLLGKKTPPDLRPSTSCRFYDLGRTSTLPACGRKSRGTVEPPIESRDTSR